MPHISSIRSWSIGDVIAGITVAATSLPQYIAYAELAGLSGHKGLSTSGPPLIFFALVTGSSSLCIGVTSIAALMAMGDLRGAEYKEAYGEEAWADLLGTYAVLVGLASIILAVSGATKLTQYIPEAVNKGWKLGFAITVVGAQTAGAAFARGSGFVSKTCVVPAELSRGAVSMYRLFWILTHPMLWDPTSAALAALTLFIVLKCKTVLVKVLRLPGVEVLAATAVGALISVYSGYSGDVVGMPPPAPPSGATSESLDILGILSGFVRQWPWEMPWAALFDRLGGWPIAILSAGAYAGVDFLAIISCQGQVPPKDGWSAQQELSGQGVGCIVSGMVGSAPVGGSLSRTAVAGLTGATSPVMGLVCGIVTMNLGSPKIAMLLAPTPKSVLAAVVLAAVLPSVVYPKDVLKFKGKDAIVAWMTALASAFTDPTIGFALGLAVSALVAAPGFLRRRQKVE